ncbi:hypothetical protein QR680_014236 [Steinernema hermaphroditum]|uniref:HTH CENPB-type domain-containing protein n=1 Tax=Steinernema hermaphroditum TaxID=289476 RepID=A0AA39IAW7_9BILA|nr:hypothetical protein QR680_014236 [Steinernema hermaphroditum]
MATKKRALLEPPKDRGFNPSNIVKLLSMRFPLDQCDYHFTDAEESICASIIEYIVGIREADESLTFDPQENDDGESSGEDYTEIEEVKRKLTSFKYSRSQMERIVKDHDENGMTFADIQHHYKMVKSRADLARMRRYITHSVRLEEAEIKDELLIAFQEWVRNGHHINDRDLHLEALEIARRKNHTTFKAGPTFILEFKKKNNIVSRKVTQSTTTKQFVDVERQKEVCQEFRDGMKSLISNHPNKKKIFNSDQTGLKLELRAGRTLAIKGSKQVRVVVQRENALTHSLTLQPVISANGFLQTPMMVCFLERHPPAKFRDELAEFQFLHCVHSASGMMTADLACTWISDVFLPNGGQDSVLLIDSWSGYNRAMNEFGTQNHQIEFHVIPPHTTGDVQPLDVFFNRQLKAFHRHLTELLCRLRPDFIVSTAIAGCLLQADEEGAEHPVSYASRILQPAEKRYHSMEQEALAIVFALQQFAPYIEGNGVTTVRTDNQPICALLKKQNLPPRLQRFQLAIQSYNIDLHHRSGDSNKMCDFLSRYPAANPGDEDLVALLIADIEAQKIDDEAEPEDNEEETPQVSLDEIREEQLKIPEYKKLIDALEANIPEAVANFEVKRFQETAMLPLRDHGAATDWTMRGEEERLADTDDGETHFINAIKKDRLCHLIRQPNLRKPLAEFLAEASEMAEKLIHKDISLEDVVSFLNVLVATELDYFKDGTTPTTSDTYVKARKLLMAMPKSTIAELEKKINENDDGPEEDAWQINALQSDEPESVPQSDKCQERTNGATRKVISQRAAIHKKPSDDPLHTPGDDGPNRKQQRQNRKIGRRPRRIQEERKTKPKTYVKPHKQEGSWNQERPRFAVRAAATIEVPPGTWMAIPGFIPLPIPRRRHGDYYIHSYPDLEEGLSQLGMQAGSIVPEGTVSINLQNTSDHPITVKENQIIAFAEEIRPPPRVFTRIPIREICEEITAAVALILEASIRTERECDKWDQGSRDRRANRWRNPTVQESIADIAQRLGDPIKTTTRSRHTQVTDQHQPRDRRPLLDFAPGTLLDFAPGTLLDFAPGAPVELPRRRSLHVPVHRLRRVLFGGGGELSSQAPGRR